MEQDVKVRISELFLDVVQQLINSGRVKNERAFCQSINTPQQIFSDIKGGRRQVTLEIIHYTCFEYKINPIVFFPVVFLEETGIEKGQKNNSIKIAPKIAPEYAPNDEIQNETIHLVEENQAYYEPKNDRLNQEISELKEKLRYADLAIASYQRTVAAYEDMDRMNKRIETIEKKIGKSA